MSRCEYCIDEVCVNADCPMCADFCPVPDEDEGICRFEKRVTSTGKIKIYIAGKISGDNKYKQKFKKTKEKYEKEGHIVLNPACLPEGMKKSDYMRICFAMIDSADMVIFLPDYTDSKGAQVELCYCKYIEKSIDFIGDNNEMPI